MIPALGMVILPQNPSTENGQIPGCSCILSVVRFGSLFTLMDSFFQADAEALRVSVNKMVTSSYNNILCSQPADKVANVLCEREGTVSTLRIKCTPAKMIYPLFGLEA